MVGEHMGSFGSLNRFIVSSKVMSCECGNRASFRVIVLMFPGSGADFSGTYSRYVDFHLQYLRHCVLLSPYFQSTVSLSRLVPLVLLCDADVLPGYMWHPSHTPIVVWKKARRTLRTVSMTWIRSSLMLNFCLTCYNSKSFLKSMKLW